MYYKIKDTILWRNEKNSLMILNPISKKLMIYGKDISDFVTNTGVMDGEKIKNKKVISNLLDESIISFFKIYDKAVDGAFGSSPTVSAPLNVTIQVTNRCNLQCKHCHRVDKGCIDLDKEKFMSLIDELSDMKVFNINLSGGEPLLYNDLFDIIEYIISKGMKVTMSTNLILWNEDVAKKLYDLGIRQIHISLDSADEKYHDELRGSDGAYSTTLKNLALIKECGIEFTLVTTLVNQSINDYSNIIDLAYNLGASSHKTNILIPQGQGSNLDVSYYKDKDLLKSYIKVFSEKKKEYLKKMSVIGETMFTITMGNIEGDKPDILKVGCPAGILTAAITERGELLACPFYSELSVGNIYEDSFKYLWENSQVLTEIRAFKNNTNSGCQARAYSISKSTKEEDPYTFKKVNDYNFYNESAESRNMFIKTVGHGINIEGEKGNKNFYGMVHNYLLNANLTLEIGTGTGIVPLTLGKLGKKIISIDFSQNMLNIAKENCREYDNIVFQKENIHNLSFNDNSFDLVIKRLAPDDLGEIFRVLNDHGNFVNFTNGEKDGRELKNLFGLPYHESVYEYRLNLIDHGFNIIKEDEFEFKEIYPDLDTLIKMLHIAPIIPDFLEKETYYTDKIKENFDPINGFILTRHKYLVNARK